MTTAKRARGRPRHTPYLYDDVRAVQRSLRSTRRQLERLRWTMDRYATANLGLAAHVPDWWGYWVNNRSAWEETLQRMEAACDALQRVKAGAAAEGQP